MLSRDLVALAAGWSAGVWGVWAPVAAFIVGRRDCARAQDGGKTEGRGPYCTAPHWPSADAHFHSYPADLPRVRALQEALSSLLLFRPQVVS